MIILRNCEAGGSLKDTMAMVVISASERFHDNNITMITIIKITWVSGIVWVSSIIIGPHSLICLLTDPPP
jgi:hypothetical protein